MNQQKYTYLFFILTFIWCFGIMSPVIFQNNQTFLAAKPFLNQVYSTVCHQEYAKTLKIYDEEIFVCSRCAGIYTGVFMAILLSLFRLPKSRLLHLLISSSVFLLSDVILSSIGIYSYSKYFALSTGLFFGLTLFMFLLSELKFSEQIKQL